MLSKMEVLLHCPRKNEQQDLLTNDERAMTKTKTAVCQNQAHLTYKEDLLTHLNPDGVVARNNPSQTNLVIPQDPLVSAMT